MRPRPSETVDQLGEIGSGGNLMAFNMMAALSATGSDTLEVIEKESRYAQTRVKSNIDSLPQNHRNERPFAAAASKLLVLGDGKTGIFRIRQRELDADDYGQLILEESRKLNVGLGHQA